MREILRIAHRGASGYKPENTLAAFSKALEMGVDAIELDVRICGTGELIVFHDPTLGHTINGTGVVADIPLGELKELDIGEGERIPTIEEAIDLVDRKVILNIEMKGGSVAEPLSKILRGYLQKGYPPELFLVSSFNKKELREFALKNPGVRLGILVARGILSVPMFAKKYNVYSIHLPQPYVKKWLIKFFQKRGFKVFIYTPNSIWDIAKAKVAEVDGIFSDYPDRI